MHIHNVIWSKEVDTTRKKSMRKSEKISSRTTRHRAYRFGMLQCLLELSNIVLIYSPGAKGGQAQGETGFRPKVGILRKSLFVQQYNSGECFRANEPVVLNVIP